MGRHSKQKIKRSLTAKANRAKREEYRSQRQGDVSPEPAQPCHQPLQQSLAPLSVAVAEPVHPVTSVNLTISPNVRPQQQQQQQPSGPAANIHVPAVAELYSITATLDPALQQQPPTGPAASTHMPATAELDNITAALDSALQQQQQPPTGPAASIHMPAVAELDSSTHTVPLDSATLVAGQLPLQQYTQLLQLFVSHQSLVTAPALPLPVVSSQAALVQSVADVLSRTDNRKDNTACDRI